MFGSCATSIGDLSNEYLGDVIFSSSVKNIPYHLSNRLPLGSGIYKTMALVCRTRAICVIGA